MDPEALAAAGGQMSQMFGGLGGAIGMQMGGNPYSSAQPYYNQLPGTANRAFNPWMQQGLGANQALSGQYNQLISNPGGMLNQIGGSYHQSPGYQWQLSQALNSMNNAAAAGGMAGSPQEQYQMGQAATGMANQDYWHYMGNAMNMYGQGLQGLQGQQQLGYNASHAWNNSMQSALMAQGNLAYNKSQYGADQDIAMGNAIGSLF